MIRIKKSVRSSTPVDSINMVKTDSLNENISEQEQNEKQKPNQDQDHDHDHEHDRTMNYDTNLDLDLEMDESKQLRQALLQRNENSEEPENHQSNIFKYTNLAPQHEQKEQWRRWIEQTTVAIALSVLLGSSLANSIAFKLMADKVPYPYFLTQLTTVVYVPIFGALLYGQYCMGQISQETLNFPKRAFFVMGALDCCQGVLMLFGSSGTPGSLQALLGQSNIPCTMGLSMLILGTKYTRLQYAGALIVLVGVVVALVPSLAVTQSAGENLLFNFIFVLGVVPTALSAIFKERVFGEADISVNYLQFWVAVWQFLFGILLAPVNALPFLGDEYIPLNQLPSSITNGASCLAGFNSRPSDDCEGSWRIVLFYMISNIVFNISFVAVIKLVSANVTTILMTCRLPLLQMAFAMPWIQNPPDTITGFTISGLITILLGIIMYRWTSITDVKTKGNSITAKQADLHSIKADEMPQSLYIGPPPLPE